MALCERKKATFRLKAEALDYSIAGKLKIETPNVTRARTNVLKKLEHTKADLAFVDRLKSKQIRNSGISVTADVLSKGY